MATTSVLLFDATTDELVRVLADARCSFVDASGRYLVASGAGLHLGRRSGLAGSVEAAFATADPRAVATIDLRAGRDGRSPAVLANPIELLEWCHGQAAAIGMHPTIDAYLGASNPDFHLPFLPFHPRGPAGGDGVSRVLAVRAELATDGDGELIGLELVAPDSARR